ncbi:Type II restriction/modification system, DNA methylase subunit YeeA [Prevotella sp. tc2-28]|uniref:DNA methyltransferase n=1 Tax=Prevotella sp. tc2-28 TaxID=1761888 RepID=UPI00089C5D85|nr:DNA methyltransferase [Prevotella sp. tc2-28]SEA19262.1 Type II restriction/modification system, DNA methylase subunit YeeA [Prevotella sp. tc2-28]
MDIQKVSDRKEAARQFVKNWMNRGHEIEDYQEFWEDLLEDVFGVPKARKEILPQQKVKVAKSTKRMDILLKTSKVVIEQKNRGVDLEKEEKTKGGSPIEQVQFYHEKMDKDKSGRYAIACNFSEFKIWDSYNKNAEIKTIKLEELPKRWKELRFLVEPYKPEGYVDPNREEKVASRASEYIQNLYNAIFDSKQKWTKQELQWLNMFCVRAVFCLYAEDAGLFGDEQFSLFIEKTPADEMSDRFDALFVWLDSNDKERKNLSAFVGKTIRNFPWVNGGLFDKKVDYKTPEINEAARNILLNADNLKMDNGEIFSWEEISPTNFGCIFESTVDMKVRDSGGMHYTTPENIRRAINPLFLEDLTTELNEIIKYPIETEGDKDVKYSALENYRKKLSGLRFLDPACGSGNFLTETYKALHQLELQAIESELKFRHGLRFGNENPCYVRMGQFFGIEIDHFAASVARASLWIADCQLLKETKMKLNCNPDILPLEKNNNIQCADALYTDWNEVLKRKRSTPIFIIGNPPFKGARGGNDTPEEKEQKKLAMKAVMSELDKNGHPVWNHVGDLDFVCAWYAKAAQYMQGFPLIQAALVSTNSIVQGEHAVNLWKPLMQYYGVNISFAWRTFKWFNEAKKKAQVSCVIIGFYCSRRANTQTCVIFKENESPKLCQRINNYLISGDSLFLNVNRKKPVCDVPIIGIGNKPIDGGNYLFTKEQKDAFIAIEPLSASYFHKWYGADEFLSGIPRYCLWLGDCEPDEIDRMPHCKKRVEAVVKKRLESDSEQTRLLASKPTRFHVENMPESDYLIIPEVSSERRKYIPFGYMTPDIMCSNKVRLMTNVTPFHFGILSSRVHMAWVRLVCGRLEDRLDYSIEIVYNNFPWPDNVQESIKEKIVKSAQGIITARNNHPNSSLKQLYEYERGLTPPDLTDAHDANDKAVFAAYAYLGIRPNMSDEEIAMILLRESVRLAKLADNKKRTRRVSKRKNINQK